MPDLNGLDLQGMITVSFNRMPFIFISGYSDFLTKPINSEELFGPIWSALARSEELRREDDAQARLQRLYDTLTPRECEIIVGMTKGLLNKQIAHDLGIS